MKNNNLFNTFYIVFVFVELRSQLVEKQQLLMQAQEELETMNEYQVNSFKEKHYSYKLVSVNRQFENKTIMK